MEKRSVFVLGDSISIYYGPHLKRFVAGLLDYDRKRGEEEAIADLDNPVGANGGDSRMVLEYLREQNSRGVTYDILMVNCGLHDIKTDPEKGTRQVDVEEYERNLVAITKLGKEMSETMLWVTTTPIHDEQHNSRMKEFFRYSRDVDEYNRSSDRAMSEAGIERIDLYGFTTRLGPDIFRDHAHFTEETAAWQAAFIAGYLYACI